MGRIGICAFVILVSACKQAAPASTLFDETPGLPLSPLARAEALHQAMMSYDEAYAEAQTRSEAITMPEPLSNSLPSSTPSGVASTEPGDDSVVNPMLDP